jgi:maleate isomerase
VVRIGAIYPNDAWVDCEAKAVVDEFRRFLPEGAELVSAGTPNPAVDNTLDESIKLAENGDIEEAALRLVKYEPSGFAYYCTTMSFVRGPGGDLDISRRITAATGKPATTTSTAMIRALSELGLSRIAVASPYLPDVEEKFIGFFRAHGIEVVRNLALAWKRDHSIVPSDEIRLLAEAADHPAAEAVFVGCTGQKLARYIDAMEAKLGKPVLTANQVTTWDALRIIGICPRKPGRGRLFAGNFGNLSTTPRLATDQGPS